MELDDCKLLRGKSVFIEGVGELKPITVDEIVDVGYLNYCKYLSNICFEIDDLNTTQEEKQKLIDEGTKTFEIITSICLYDVEYLQLIIKALKFFFHEDVCFCKEYCIFFINEFNEYRFLTSENFEDIKKILKLQNCLLKNDVLEENPKDERTRILLEKRKKAREKLAKAKARQNQDESETITFADIISIMCANANGVNYENVWGMNYYMFQNQFQRMKLIDDFDISIRSLLAGAKSEEVEIKHYISHL